MVKKTTSKSTTSKSKQTASKRFLPKGGFERWILPGIITIVLYLFTALLSALYFHTDKDLGQTTTAIISFLFVATGLTAFWWLIESARWIIDYIDSRSAKKSSSKRKK